MNDINNSCIAAIATAQGVGAISVIRISGENSQKIADKIFKGNKKISDIPSYTALFGKVYDTDGSLIDEAIALNFIAPRSYTGENSVEISCHGGIYTTKRVLQALINAGARLATQGEFTKRAFLNGKLDLAQAESVIELISASSKRSFETAMSVKEGKLSKQIDEILSILVDLGGDLSAWADYPDDDMPQVNEKDLSTKLTAVCGKLDLIIKNFDSGKIYRDGINTVIAGKPNAGKSSLMNLLSGCERSIVTDIAGTTRDVVEERVMLGDIPLILADTAGIRDTNDPVEKIGVSLAKKRIMSAELVLAVFDSSVPLDEEDKALIEMCKERPCIAIVNKNDLEQKIDLAYIESNLKHCVSISAINTNDSTEIQKIVENLFGAGQLETGAVEICTQRQREAILRAKMAVDQAIIDLNFMMTLDAITVIIEEAVSALLELKGEKVSETLVNNVFSRFCVGK